MNCPPLPTRTLEEIRRADDVYMELHYLGLESLRNLFCSVLAEIERKGGKPPIDVMRMELNRELAARKPKPKSLAPCVGCQAPLSARERRLPCPYCGARNPR